MILLFAALLIRNVAVLDLATGHWLPHRTIEIRNDTITSVRAAPPRRVPPGSTSVNAAGKFAIPGLWDMHVHLWARDPQLPAYVLHGVTGVRDMGSNFAHIKELRQEIGSGKLTGPRIETCGSPVDGASSNDEVMPIVRADTPNEARRVYDQLEQEGVDFIKVLSSVPRDAYFALVERARKWGLQVAGHVPDSVTAFEAVEAHQDSLEHLTGIAQAATNEDKARSLFQRMALFKIAECPTLGKLEREKAPDFDRDLQFVAGMQRAGVPLLAGSNSGTAGTQPGAELHHELALLVKAGLSPLEALRAATLNPAQYLHAEERLGTIAPGHLADIVLLDADPLVNIQRTRRIWAVVANGRLLHVETVHRSKPHPPKDHRKIHRRR